MKNERFRVDLSDERLWKGDRPLQLTNKAFQLLRLLLQRPNLLLTKEEILEGVWGDVCVSEGLIKEYVHDLREVLGDNARTPRFIETVHGRGYRYLGGIDGDRGGAGAKGRNRPPARGLALAVLAFVNLSNDPNQEYFADGISEDIMIGLSKNPHLSVISRNSTFAFKGRSVTVREIGKALDAQFVLEGSVRRVGRHLRITAQLIDAESEHHLWAEAYNRDLGEIFTVQDEVVSSIVHALGATDGAIERLAGHRIDEGSESKLTAYDFYLRAQKHFYQRHASGYDEAQALYEKAIALNPDFARAHSALAFLLFQRFKVYHQVSLESIEPRTRELAARALSLDPNEYVAHWALGRLYSYQGKHDQSLAEFDRALDINPNDANVLNDSADYLVYRGRTAEAVENCKRAIRLNPHCPDWYWWNLGFSYYHLGRYEDALKALRKMTSPGQARRLLAAVYAKLGRTTEARSEAVEFMKMNPKFSITKWARMEPYTDPIELERYVSGQREAGLPE